MLRKDFGSFKRFVDLGIGLLFDPLRLITDPADEIHHSGAGRNAVGGVAVEHQEIGVAGFFSDAVDQFQALFDAARIGMQENRAVLVPFRSFDKDAGHVFPVELPLFLRHLKPLAVLPVTRMHLTECLHGEKKDQFKMRHASL